MARFDLSAYETVEERIRRFYADNPDGRIITENLTTPADRAVQTWVIRSVVYLTAGDQANNLPKASGLAFEVDGGFGANQTSALENAETSAIGRALANAGYSGNKRASREEMEKVERQSATEVMHQFAQRDWKKDADTLNDVEALRTLWANAKAKKAPASVLDYIKERANALSDNSSEPRRAEGSIPGLFDTPAPSGDGKQIDPEPKAKGRK
jgi:hypothetical protein